MFRVVDVPDEVEHLTEGELAGQLRLQQSLTRLVIRNFYVMRTYRASIGSSTLSSSSAAVTGLSLTTSNTWGVAFSSWELRNPRTILSAHSTSPYSVSVYFVFPGKLDHRRFDRTERLDNNTRKQQRGRREDEQHSALADDIRASHERLLPGSPNGRIS